MGDEMEWDPLKVYREQWITPDWLLEDSRSVTFAYDTRTRKLFTGPGDRNHGYLINQYPDELNLEDYTRRGDTPVLYGRLGLGGGMIVISFWNPEPLEHPLYQDLGRIINGLRGSIERLRTVHPDYPIVVSVSHEGTLPVKQLRKVGPRSIPLTSKEKAKLLQKLHLLWGLEKQAAMEVLGLGFDPSYDPHSFVTRFKQVTGQAYPPYSESEFEQIVNRLLEGEE
jgi:hypothetical protein